MDIGITLNDKADGLARKGTSTPFAGPESFCVIGLNTIKGVLKEKEYSKWARYCTDLQLGTRRAKTIQRDVNWEW